MVASTVGVLWGFDSPTSYMQDSFYTTVVNSPEFKVWIEYQRKLQLKISELSEEGLSNIPIYDIDETIECGLISPSHFESFLEFVRLGLSELTTEK
jgi:hypothetical protein